MKKLILLLLMAVIAVGNTYGQTKKKVAILPIFGNFPDGLKEFVQTMLERGIANSENYVLLNDNDDYQHLLKEFDFQGNSEEVDDEQVKTFGSAVNADMVCYVGINSSKKDTIITYIYNMIDMSSSEIPKAESIIRKNGGPTLESSMINIAQKFFGNEFSVNVIDKEKAKFKGGDENDFAKWVARNMKYPRDARDKGITGRVICSFVVDTDGKVIEVEVVRSAHPLLDKEAVRVVSSSPKWTPAELMGKKLKQSTLYL